MENNFLSTEIIISKKDDWESLRQDIFRVDHAGCFSIIKIEDKRRENTLHNKLLKKLKEMGFCVQSNKRKKETRKKFNLTPEQLYALSYYHKVSVHADMSGWDEPEKEYFWFLEKIHFIEKHRYAVSIQKNGILHLKEAGLYKKDQHEYNSPDRPSIEKLIDTTPRKTLSQEIAKLRGPDLLYAGEYLGKEYKKNIPIHNQVVKLIGYHGFSFSHNFSFYDNSERIIAYAKELEKKKDNVIEVDFQQKKRV